MRPGCTRTPTVTALRPWRSWCSEYGQGSSIDAEVGVNPTLLLLPRDEGASPYGARNLDRRAEAGLLHPFRHLAHGIAAPLRHVHQEHRVAGNRQRPTL